MAKLDYESLLNQITEGVILRSKIKIYEVKILKYSRKAKCNAKYN